MLAWLSSLNSKCYTLRGLRSGSLRDTSKTWAAFVLSSHRTTLRAAEIKQSAALCTAGELRCLLNTWDFSLAAHRKSTWALIKSSLRMSPQRRLVSCNIMTRILNMIKMLMFKRTEYVFKILWHWSQPESSIPNIVAGYFFQEDISLWIENKIILFLNWLL